MLDDSSPVWMIRAKIDHDLRSSLNVILGYCSILEDETEPGRDNITECLHYIRAAGEDLLRLNNQVEDLVKIERNQWQSNQVEVDLEFTLAQIVDTVQRLFQNHTINVTGSAQITGDEFALSRLIESLLISICRATVDGCTISITVSEEEKSTVISLRCEVETSAYGRDLASTLARMADHQNPSSNIRDFDAYYIGTLASAINATLASSPDELSCTIFITDPQGN